MDALATQARRSQDAHERLVVSYRACARLARRAASSFYLSFWLLPKRQRLATCALYAFYRRTDDLVDAAARERAGRALDEWRDELSAVLAGDAVCGELLPAVADTVARYEIPPGYLFDAIEGVRMDLGDVNYESAGDLEAYCYRVASVVGLACIHVWGFNDPRAIEAATQCGYAFQWTNILRDVAADARAGRFYSPMDTFRAAGCSRDDIVTGRNRERLANALAEETRRAREYYAVAASLADYLSPEGRRVFVAMFRTYRELLDRVEQAGDGILDRPVRVPTWRKLLIATGALFESRRSRARAAAP